MMSSRHRLLPALLLLAAGCADPTAPGEQGQLDAARARWRAQGGDSYTVEISRSCFCVLGGRRVTVTVTNGAVVGADYLDSGGPVETALLTYIPTIPDLFDLIQDALDKNPASFLAIYDPTYGYPTRIEIDFSATVADDELAITARDLLLARSLAP